MVHAAILHSQYAHAKLANIDTERAAKHDGVVAVFTDDDVESTELSGHLPLGLEMPGLVNAGQ